jgi:hypothetical protein
MTRAAHASYHRCPDCRNPMSEAEWRTRHQRGGVCQECRAMRAEHTARRQQQDRGVAVRYAEE